MGPPARVLLVEDDAALRRSLVLALRDEDFEVLEAGSGQQGLRAIEDDPGAVLLDLGLPDLDGLLVLERLRSRSPVPILVLSGRRHAGDQAGALAAGADDYLVKPVPAVELSTRVRALLRPLDRGALATALAGQAGAAAPAVGATAYGGPVPASPTSTEQLLLAELARTPCRVPPAVLARRVWGSAPAAGEAVLQAHVRSLRGKLTGSTISVTSAGYRLDR